MVKAETKKIIITRSTIVNRVAVFAGDTVEVELSIADRLIQMGKAEPVETKKTSPSATGKNKASK